MLPPWWAAAFVVARWVSGRWRQLASELAFWIELVGW
jgi:hypothetical protein